MLGYLMSLDSNKLISEEGPEPRSSPIPVEQFMKQETLEKITTESFIAPYSANAIEHV